MDFWLNVRDRMSKDRVVDHVIKSAKSMGYQINPKRIPETFQGKRFDPDESLAQAMVVIEIPDCFDHIYLLEPSQRQLAEQKYNLCKTF